MKFVATRIMLYTLFTIVLPVVLFNVFIKIQTEILTYISTQLNAADPIQNAVIELTGLGAWFADNLQLQACLSVILSAVSLRFMLNIIRLKI